MKKTCEECKKEFESDLHHRTYCSDVCAGNAMRRKLRENKAKYQKRVYDASKPQ
jgi:hypothetical protein